MKKIIILLLLPVLTACCGHKQQPVLPQTAETDVVKAVDRLMKGMVDADESLLKSVLAEELVYVHSNGREQNKSEFIAEVLSGDPMKYLSTAPLDQTIRMAGEIAVVRHIFTAETKSIDGEPGTLRIGAMLVWQLQNDEWKLLARQGYRLL